MNVASRNARRLPCQGRALSHFYGEAFGKEAARLWKGKSPPSSSSLDLSTITTTGRATAG